MLASISTVSAQDVTGRQEIDIGDLIRRIRLDIASAGIDPDCVLEMSLEEIKNVDINYIKAQYPYKKRL
ncbi:hypothetical protein [Mesobacillus zeae]|uniref:hypothetical protein n=1 Tax=Mesobacillus zeae TaxID=1917180 RepID=UPI003008DE33